MIAKWAKLNENNKSSDVWWIGLTKKSKQKFGTISTGECTKNTLDKKFRCLYNSEINSHIEISRIYYLVNLQI